MNQVSNKEFQIDKNWGTKTSSMLVELISNMTSIRNEDNSKISANIAIFIQRCIDYKMIYSREVIYLTIIYFLKVYTDKILHKYSSYSIFVICFIIATKMLEDIPYDNQSISQISRIPLSQLNFLELEFLKAVDFDVNISVQEFENMSACTS